MRQIINVIQMPEDELAVRISSLNDHEQHYFEEAVGYLLAPQPDSQNSASDVLWLMTLGKELIELGSRLIN